MPPPALSPARSQRRACRADHPPPRRTRGGKTRSPASSTTSRTALQEWFRTRRPPTLGARRTQRISRTYPRSVPRYRRYWMPRGEHSATRSIPREEDSALAPSLPSQPEETDGRRPRAVLPNHRQRTTTFRKVVVATFRKVVVSASLRLSLRRARHLSRFAEGYPPRSFTTPNPHAGPSKRPHMASSNPANRAPSS